MGLLGSGVGVLRGNKLFRMGLWRVVSYYLGGFPTLREISSRPSSDVLGAVSTGRAVGTMSVRSTGRTSG